MQSGWSEMLLNPPVNPWIHLYKVSAQKSGCKTWPAPLKLVHEL